MLSQSQKLPDMIEFITDIKKKYSLNVTAVSNEGRELTEHRIKEFELNKLFDAFVASSFVHFRKPDIDIYKIALDIAQTDPQNVLYLDDRHMFIEVAATLGINGIHHCNFQSTKTEFADYGLS